MVMPRAQVTIMFGMLALLLTGCGAGVHSEGTYAYGASAPDVTGEWSSVNTDATLSLRADGSFIGESWPDEVACGTAIFRSVDQLSDAALVDVGGDWTVDPGSRSGGWLPAVHLNFAGGSCEPSTVTAFLWRDAAGATSICALTDSHVDFDNIVPNFTLIFSSSGSDQGQRGRACFD
jgi:hypothetical protein